jgi:hypothetical protein
MDEGDRWFHVEMERPREMRKRAELAKRRAERSARREEKLQRAFAGTTPGIRMQITEWVYDEYGNLCRKIYAD